MTRRRQYPLDKVVFDGRTFFANYAGDVTLTPVGLQYLGMIPWTPRPHLVPLPPETLQDLRLVHN